MTHAQRVVSNPRASLLTLASSLTLAVPRFLGVDYNDRGRPVKPTTRRVGTTSKDFAQKHSLGTIRIETDNEEILGYLLREDLAGVRVAHGVNERSQYGQARRLHWVIDDVPFYNIRKIVRLD